MSREVPLGSWAVRRLVHGWRPPVANPSIIKSDNGTEFVATRIQEWLEDRPTCTYFIEPGSLWENGHNESFNGVLRDGCLNRWAFMLVREAQLVVEGWCAEYNEERPHGALNQTTPAAYAARVVLEQGASSLIAHLMLRATSPAGLR